MSSSSARVDRVGGHHGFPLRPFGVADLDGDGPAQGDAVAHPGQHGHRVALELHPRAAAVAEPAAGQLVGDVGGGDFHAGDHAFDHGHQRAAVRFPGGDPAQHPPIFPWAQPAGSRCSTLQHRADAQSRRRGDAGSIRRRSARAAAARGGQAHRGAVRHSAPPRSTDDHSAVSSGARQRRQEPHRRPRNSPLSPPRPIASLTSPAPIAAGAARCTSRYTAGQCRGPGQRGQPAAGQAAQASRITTGARQRQRVRQPPVPDVVAAQHRQPGQ